MSDSGDWGDSSGEVRVEGLNRGNNSNLETGKDEPVHSQQGNTLLVVPDLSPSVDGDSEKTRVPG